MTSEQTLIHDAGGLQKSIDRDFIIDDPAEVGDDQICAGLLGAFDEQAGGVCVQPVVAVDELQVLAARAFNGQIARRGNAAVLLVNYTEPGIALGVHAADLQTGVTRAVVDQQNFDILIALAAHTLDAGCKVGRGVVNRDNNADKRCIGIQGDTSPLSNEMGLKTLWYIFGIFLL